MTKGEQLKLMNRLLGDTSSSKSLDPTEKPRLIDSLYCQILSEAFSELNDELLDDRLRILHTLLCTEERVSTLVAAQLLSESADMVDLANRVVKELHAVLYIKDGHVFWYHTSFSDFIFDQKRSKFTISTVLPSISGREFDMSCNLGFHYALLTRSCFRIMMSGLHFNICNLPLV